MPDALLAHVRRYVPLREEDITLLRTRCTLRHVGKKQNLLTEGNVSPNFFVAKGGLRMFFINEKGVEQTTQFALENWWLADYHSFETQQPSDFYIQTIELSEVIVLDEPTHRQLLVDVPSLERYFRLVQQRAYAAYQLRVKYIYDLSKEERYRHFTERFPEFAQRIPQYLLASYLGFTPEYLSEIRRKRIS